MTPRNVRTPRHRVTVTPEDRRGGPSSITPRNTVTPRRVPGGHLRRVEDEGDATAITPSRRIGGLQGASRLSRLDVSRALFSAICTLQRYPSRHLVPFPSSGRVI